MREGGEELPYIPPAIVSYERGEELPYIPPAVALRYPNGRI